MTLDRHIPESPVPGSPRNPRKEFAVGVWRAAAFAAAALTVCASVAVVGADEEKPPEAAGRVTLGRLLGPLGDFVPGGAPPPPPPAPQVGTPDGPAIGRATIGGVLTASSRVAYTWAEGDEQVALLWGSCSLQQGETRFLANEAVLWRRTTPAGDRVVLYLDGEARLEQPGTSRAEPSMLFELDAPSVEFQTAGKPVEASQADSETYRRAVARRNATAAQTTRSAARPPEDLMVPGDPGAFETIRLRPAEGRLRRVRIFPRTGVPFDFETFRSTNSIPPEQITVITGGVNVLIDGFDDQGLVDLMADRAVIWTQAMGEDFQSEQVQTQDTPYTVYLEGHIVIRQGDRTVKAERAVYDAREERALMENAELRTFLPELGSDLRVRACEMRQLARGTYQAFNAWSTTSQFGRPGYRFESREIFVEPRYDVDLGWLGVGGDRVVDPATGMEMVETNWVRSYNNRFYVGEVPVLYSPYVAGPAEDINIPLRSATIGSNTPFGMFVKTAWDPFDLFGVQEPPGVKLNLLADYFSKRGPGAGLSGTYSGDGPFGVDTYRGTGIGYFVHDEGKDRLGFFRRDVPLETNDRWRIKWRHRHDFLPYAAHVNAELGVLSDKNFLEQYFEREFDADKDQENVLYGTQSLAPWGLENWAWEGLGKVRLNDFETETGWYPKGDLWGLGESFLDGRLTWSSHTQAGYGDIDPADPSHYLFNEKFFTPLPYAPDVEGGVFMTRHELDAPLLLGPVNVTPFAMGEAAAWDEAIDGNDLARLTSSIGTRASVQFQRTYPGVFSRILGLNGLAHKIRLEAEYRVTDTTAPFTDVAQYNEIDDNAQERLRYRIPQAYYKGTLPPQFDPRFYAIRTGAGLPVGSPYYELVEDQQVARLAMRQRLQTKSGPPGRLRIRDWMTFDTGVSLFPNPERDNFGQTAGLFFVNYGWFVSERTKIVASTQLDFFERAPQLWDVGFFTQRSARGSLYMGLRHIEAAPLNSDILIGSYSYVMSPKWISTLTAYVDTQRTQNSGQSFTLTRTGADFLIHMGLNQNNSAGNVGVMFAIEPRFGRPIGQRSARGLGSGSSGMNTMQLSSLLTPPVNP